VRRTNAGKSKTSGITSQLPKITAKGKTDEPLISEISNKKPRRCQEKYITTERANRKDNSNIAGGKEIPTANPLSGKNDTRGSNRNQKFQRVRGSIKRKKQKAVSNLSSQLIEQGVRSWCERCPGGKVRHSVGRVRDYSRAAAT